MRKREYLKRRALGQKMLRGRPKKLSVAAEKTDLELDQVAEVLILDGSSWAKRSKSPQRAAPKPLTPDGNPLSPLLAPTIAKPALPTFTAPTAPALQPQVADEERCLICLQGQIDTAAGVLLPMYLPCCPSRMHKTCLSTWRSSSWLVSGQMMENVHNCPSCMSHLVGTRDLRDTAPTKADMRKFHRERDDVKKQRLDFGRC